MLNMECSRTSTIERGTKNSVVLRGRNDELTSFGEALSKAVVLVICRIVCYSVHTKSIQFLIIIHVILLIRTNPIIREGTFFLGGEGLGNFGIFSKRKCWPSLTF